VALPPPLVLRFLGGSARLRSSSMIWWSFACNSSLCCAASFWISSRCAVMMRLLFSSFWASSLSRSMVLCFLNSISSRRSAYLNRVSASTRWPSNSLPTQPQTFPSLMRVFQQHPSVFSVSVWPSTSCDSTSRVARCSIRSAWSSSAQCNRAASHAA